MKKLLMILAIALVALAASVPAVAQPGKKPAAAQTPQGSGNTQTPAQPAAASTPASADAGCGCEDKPLPDVLAIVNGVRITQQDISPESRQQIEQLQRQVVEARNRELELQINSRLLEAEARKRGVSTGKVIEDEIVAKAKEPTEAEAQAFYEQNKAQIQSEFAAVKNDIIGYLRYQRQQEQAKQFADRLRAASQVNVVVKDVTPPATPADRTRLFATVNGQRITSNDIEESLRPLIFSVQEQAYTLRRRELDLKINDILLNQEAQKRQVTASSLLDTEVNSKVSPVTDAQAQAFYNENKDRINGDFAQIKTQIIQYLTEQAQQKATADFARRLRSAASVQTFLTAPEPPVYAIATDDQPTKGNASATVTVVEFTDYQCPSCAQQHPVLEKIMTEYGDRVRFVVRDFPLEQHANARKAAEAAEAAREQGKYWEYVALLFRNQSALDVPRLKEYATAIGLDRARFDAALDSGKFADKVQRDLLDGQKVGVNGTPTIYVNGRRVSDRSYEGLKATIESALKTPAPVKR